MKPISRRTLVQIATLSPLAFVAAPVHAHARASWRKSAFHTLSDLAAQRVEQGRVVGISIGVSAPGFRKIAYHGVEDMESKRPVSSETMFQIASVTKPITAALILDLCDQGILALDATIDRFFPDFPHAGDITLSQLLSHTSGLANWWGRLAPDVPTDFMDKPAPHKVLARMREPFLFNPGTMRSYSNSGYLLLGEIVEMVTGQDYAACIRHHLLSRCGASGMDLERTGDTANNWATGYVSNQGIHEKVSGTPMPFAAGGLRSNTHDVLAFSDALFHGKLLTSNSLGQMVMQARVSDGRLVQDAMYDAPDAPAEVWPENTTEFGYGFGVNTWVQSGERFYSHSGLIDGFSAYLIHAPRTKTSITFLSNSQAGTTDMGQLARDLLVGGV